MGRDRGKQRRWLGKAAVGLLLVCLAAECGLVLYKRADWRFLIAETVRGWFTHAATERVEPEELVLVKWTLPELLATGRAEQNESMMLVNASYRLSDGFEADVSEYRTSGVWMGTCIQDAYARLSADVRSGFGEELYVSSSYRTSEKQREVLSESAAGVAAEVGASEHQAGLALDVYLSGYAGRAILKCEAGRWINRECYRYGFVIRYPLFKEKITGTVPEPWHIRYVGVPHAEIMYRDRMVLEEYLEFLDEAPYWRYGSYLISRQEGEPFLLPEDFSFAVISTDNRGGYVITLQTKETKE